MATVSTAIKIQDQMSPALKGMNKALMIVLNTMEKLNSASSDPIDVAGINEARSALASVNTTLDSVENNIRQAKEEQDDYTQSVNHSENAVGGLVRKVGGLIAAYATFQSLVAAVNLSDQMTQIDSRLNLVIDDGGSIEALEAEIMASANRSRASYLNTADAVSKLALRAGDSFKDANDKIDTGQIVQFTENLNKLYAIAGATQEEQASSMLQLTQALGSGVLRGEEFNAVFEAAPNIMQEVAKYMDVPIGKLRELAADGEISAEVVKNALLAATDSINEDFESMDYTWQQVMTLTKNRAIESFGVIHDKLNELANNESVQNFLFLMADGLANVANAAIWAFEQIVDFGQLIYDNWSWIAPIIYTVTAAMLIYAAALAIVKGVELASAAATAIATTAKLIGAAALMLFTGASWAAAAGQMGLNAAMYACPIVWIIALVIALVVLIVTLIGWIMKTAGVSDSVIGGIAGALSWLYSFIYNIVLAALDIILGAINYIAAPYISFANFFANLFNDPVAAIIHLFGDMADSILGILESIASAIDKVFGSNLADAVSGWRGSLDSKIETFANEKGNGSYEKVMDELNLSSESLGLERRDLTDSFDAGAAWGDGVSDKLSNFSLDSLFNGIEGYNQKENDLGIGGYGTDIPAYDELAGIHDDTGDIKDAVEISEEDLKYLRDIAEQETINRFTTAEISVDMGGVSNTINSTTDIDGFMDVFTDKLYESMSIAAEGVHD